MLQEGTLCEISQRLANEAKTIGKIHLQHCLLNEDIIERLISCLEEYPVHVLDLSYCRWDRQRDNMMESFLLLGNCLRQQNVASHLRILDLSYLSTSHGNILKLLEGLLEGASGGTGECPALRQLHLRGTNLTGEDGGKTLAAVTKACRHLDVLNLASSRKLGSSGLAAFAQGLEDNTTKSGLREINLSACLRDEDAAVVIQALANLPRLETLILTRNLLGVASRAALTRLLETTRTLRSLKFGYHGTLLTCGNAQPFAASLAASTVEALDLSLYVAQPGCLRHILGTLPQHKSLQVLAIDCAALSLLMNVLPRFSSLHTLIIRGNFEWTESVQKSFYENQSLHQRIAVDANFEQTCDLRALVYRNRAIDAWQKASQEERATLIGLWPNILFKMSGISALAFSCSVDVIRRVLVET